MVTGGVLLDSVHVPLTVPFYTDGASYLRKLEHNVRRYSLTPAAGMMVLGGLGEASMLSDAEHGEVLRTAADVCAPEKVLLAGVGRDSVAETLRLAEVAASAGYDVAVVQAGLASLAGRQHPRWTTELLTYFRMVADRSALPLLIGGQVGHALPMEVIGELQGHGQILGALEMEGDTERIAGIRAAAAEVRREVVVTTVFRAVTGRMRHQEEAPAGSGSYIAADLLSGAGAAVATAPPKPAMKTRTKVVGFQVVGGRSLEMMRSMEAGAAAVMPGLGACAPQSTYEVVAAYKDGDRALAVEKQVRLTRAAQRIDEALGVAGVKFGCDLNGYFGGAPRLPRLPVNGTERQEIEEILRPLRG